MKRKQSAWTGKNPPPNSVPAEDGAVMLRLATGAKFRITGAPPAITGESIPRQLVRDAVDVLNDLAVKTNSALTNQNLSDHGRRNAMKDTHMQSVLTTGQLWKSLDAFKHSIQERERLLYAVDPPNLNQAGAAIRAWECRSHFAALSAEQKGEFFAKIKAGSGQVEELVSALLNSPYAVASDEMAALEELWQQARRDLNPTEAEAIDADKEAADWAAATLATIAIPITEMVAMVGGPAPVHVFAEVAVDPAQLGFEAFGVAAKDIARAKDLAAAGFPPADPESTGSGSEN